MKYAILIFLFASGVIAEVILYDYSQYWQTFNNRVFNNEQKCKFNVTFKDNGKPTTEWNGDNGAPLSSCNSAFSGKEYNITIDGEHGIIIINGVKVDTNASISYEEKLSGASEGMYGNFVYLANGYTCVEEYHPAISGKGARHRFVYLIDHGDLILSGKPIIYMLPTLFQSCLSIRKKGDIIYFDKVSYSYDEKSDYPIGVIFEEYSINGDKFKQTGARRGAYFPDADNVYKFKLQK
jgi:hypothetical protein